VVVVVVVVMGWVEVRGKRGGEVYATRGGVVLLYLGDMNAMDRDLNDEPT
jgi:hypothetical protein